MGRQKGVLKVEGTLGGLTFYESQDGSLVREKGGVSGDRIAKDPKFARTRENGEEFASAGRAGKYLRDALRTMMQNAADGRVTGRLTKVMTDMLKLDATNVRGKRVPSEGVKTDAGKALLKGFNFNEKTVLGSVLFKPYTLNLATGELNFKQISPLNDLAAPQGATHAKFTLGIAIIDFATGENVVHTIVSDQIELKPNPYDFGLVPIMPSGDGLKLFIFKVEFTQMLNNAHYSLKNGSYNAMAVIEVEGTAAQASPVTKSVKKV